MQKFILLLTLSAAIVSVCGRETRNEVTKTTMPAEDSKATSRAVPDVYAIKGKFERVVILRFKHQADLLAGLEKMVKKERIRNAVVLSGIGSVRGYHIHVVSNRDFPSQNIFVKNPTAPADLVSMNGHVIDGRVHAHVTLANADKAFGGHLESGTQVFTFAIVTVGVLDDKADLRRVDDKNYR